MSSDLLLPLQATALSWDLSMLDWRPIARRILPLAACLGLALLGGCARTPIPVPTTVATPGMPNPEQALRQSMQHVDAEMAELGEMNPHPLAASSGGSDAAGPTDPVMPASLQRIVSFAWSGPLDKGVAKLAASIGYTFYVTSPASDPPLPVTVKLSSVSVYQVFKALGAEAGARATVEVDPLHHQVLVIHHVQPVAERG